MTRTWRKSDESDANTRDDRRGARQAVGRDTPRALQPALPGVDRRAGELRADASREARDRTDPDHPPRARSKPGEEVMAERKPKKTDNDTPPVASADEKPEETEAETPAAEEA